MNGSKSRGDGWIRRDFPGGFPGDTLNYFTPQGRTPLQNEAFDFMKKILLWRKNNQVISKGSMIHFMPTNGIYVYRRSYNGQHVLVMMNGNDSEKKINMERYHEILDGISKAHDVITGQEITFEPEMTFGPREIRILEY